MAKDKSDNQGGVNGDQSGTDRIPAALKEFGQKAAELAQNPIARSVIAAGLVTAAAALTANQKVRDTAKKTAKDAADATEEAAANASRIGEQLVAAATDTFRRVFNLDEGSSSGGGGSTSGGEEKPLSTPRKRSSGGKSKSAKSGKAAPGAGKASSAKSSGKATTAKAKTASGGKSGGAKRKASAGNQGGGSGSTGS